MVVYVYGCLQLIKAARRKPERRATEHGGDGLVPMTDNAPPHHPSRHGDSRGQWTAEVSRLSVTVLAVHCPDNIPCVIRPPSPVPR